MNQTIKNFWNHRKQNAWIVVEIALVAMLSFYVIDMFTVVAYDTYLCRPATDFEREHLLVAQTGWNDAMPDDTIYQADYSMANLYTLRDQVRTLPEVQSAGFAGAGRMGSLYYLRGSFSSEADSTRRCWADTDVFMLHEQYFETMGMTPVEGSPSATVLSEACPEDGAVVTRSMAQAIFGTDEVVGRRIVEWDFSDDALQRSGGPEIKNRLTIAGVVEDVRLHPRTRYAYSIFTPNGEMYDNKMLIRLRPDADPEAFIEKATGLAEGDRMIATVKPYADMRSHSIADDFNLVASLTGTFIALLLINVVLGTLGTFWLQIRKRTEDIGIMRSFGAKRRHIFAMLWSEATLLTLIGSVLGQVIWLQFAMNIGVSEGYGSLGSEQDSCWVDTFWLHYLIICGLQFLLLLAIVTLGMVVPTFRAMYKRPVEALHHE